MCYCYFYVHEIYNPVHYTIIHTFVILHQTTICKIRQLMCAKINSFLQKSVHNYIINNNEIIIYNFALFPMIKKENSQINVKTADIFGELISLLIPQKRKFIGHWDRLSLILSHTTKISNFLDSNHSWFEMFGQKRKYICLKNAIIVIQQIELIR